MIFVQNMYAFLRNIKNIGLYCSIIDLETLVKQIGYEV